MRHILREGVEDLDGAPRPRRDARRPAAPPRGAGPATDLDADFLQCSADLYARQDNKYMLFNASGASAAALVAKGEAADAPPPPLRGSP